ncbi:tannase/feruloyl esterase family alpha/beta hydrolase [Vibrio fluvialis]|nr:tannase/feruloyl esterase family alpha/beta hydrolase [Vibrio fluvialis]
MNGQFFISLMAFVALLSGCAHDEATNTNNKPLDVASSLNIVLPVKNCSDLLSTDLTTIGGTGSKVTKADIMMDSSGSSCVIEGLLAPEIGFKVQLPLESWTQRYMQLGCGGLCGRVGLMVSAADNCLAVKNNNFVLASTDMGHQGGSGDFGEDPQKRIDFAYRSMHLTSVAAKSLIKEFYGQAPRYSYFNGCSDGGREALMEAQRFPDDFDGVIAGAPAMNFSVQNSFHHGWLALSNLDENGNAIVHADKLPLLHKAVLDSCDTLDGLKDDLIQDPRACNFDPSVLLCKQGQETSTCLTTAEVQAVTNIYKGPHDKQTGLALALGAPMRGSELSWPGVFVPMQGKEDIFSKRVAEEALSGVIYQENPENFKLADLKFTEAEFEKVSALYGLYSAVNPDLSTFRSQGSKLILWHGWSDPHISPINSIAYYEAVQNQMGKDETESFMRFYLFPGMYHCFGGDGPYQFDLVTQIMLWVEQGISPYEIIAKQSSQPETFNGAGAPEENVDKPAKAGQNTPSLDRSRPVYPYPYVASYKGIGSINEAEQFEAKLGSTGPERYIWAGEKFYQPNQQLKCQVDNNQLKCSAWNQM